MNHRTQRRLSEGFTIIELLAVTTIILMITLIGYPAMRTLVERGRLVGAVRSSAAVLAAAKHDAVRLGVPVVARLDFATDELITYANLDRDAELEYNPTADSADRRADYEIARVRVPSDLAIYFWGPADKGPEGADVIDGFTATKQGTVAVFLPDGSVQDPGAFRFGDERGNFLEVRIETAATGKSDVLKWNSSPSWGGKAGWFPHGSHTASNKPLWEWY